MAVPICLPSEQAVGLAIFKKKSEGHWMDPGPMGLDLKVISDLKMSNN